MAKDKFNDKTSKDELLSDEQLDQITGGRQIPNIPFDEKANVIYNQFGNYFNRQTDFTKDKNRF